MPGNGARTRRGKSVTLDEVNLRLLEEGVAGLKLASTVA